MVKKTDEGDGYNPFRPDEFAYPRTVTAEGDLDLVIAGGLVRGGPHDSAPPFHAASYSLFQ